MERFVTALFGSDKEIAVSCKTMKEAKAWLQLAEECGCRWIDGSTPTSRVNWMYNEKTCYFSNKRALMIASLDYAKEHKYQVYQYVPDDVLDEDTKENRKLDDLVFGIM